jgi:hypothetical protein
MYFDDRDIGFYLILSNFGRVYDNLILDMHTMSI